MCTMKATDGKIRQFKYPKYSKMANKDCHFFLYLSSNGTQI